MKTRKESPYNRFKRFWKEIVSSESSNEMTANILSFIHFLNYEQVTNKFWWFDSNSKKSVLLEL